MRQILVNNDYTSNDFYYEHNNELWQTKDNNYKIKIYYKNQMSTSHKIDERIIRDLIKENIIELLITMISLVCSSIIRAPKEPN